MGMVFVLDKPFIDSPVIESIEMRCDICDNTAKVSRSWIFYSDSEREIDAILAEGWAVDMWMNRVRCPRHSGCGKKVREMKYHKSNGISPTGYCDAETIKKMGV